jgi:hypothetical protein
MKKITITNDKNFDRVKENYCPKCFFERDRLLPRDECECKDKKHD